VAQLINNIQDGITLVFLDKDELDHALAVSAARQKYNRQNQASPAHGAHTGRESPLTISNRGCRGEKALSIALDLPWDGHVGQYHMPDVGLYQVRTARLPDHRLLLHKTDDPTDVFVHATSMETQPRLVILHGWCWASDAMSHRFWTAPQAGRYCYAISKHSGIIQPIFTIPTEEEILERKASKPDVY